MRRVPVANYPRQKFSFRADVEYGIELAWNTVAQSWFISITRAGTRLVTGARVALGVNLLEGFNVGVMIAVDASNNSRSIAFDALISGDARLYYFAPSELSQ